MTPVNLRNVPGPPVRPCGLGRIVRFMVTPERAPDWQRLQRPPLAKQRRGKLVVTRRRLPEITASDTGRLLFFSDLHWDLRRRPLPPDLLVGAVNAECPDWVVFGGDLVHALDALPEALDILRAIEARRGKIAVLGNWERRHSWFAEERWLRIFDKAGFRLLSESDPIHESACGTVFCHGGAAAHVLPRSTFDRFRLIVPAHSPDAIAAAAGEMGPCFCLAGHTHGGQIRLPWIGAVYASSRYGVTFDHGWFRNRRTGTVLYVTNGVGCTGRGILRRRICCPPEIVCFVPGDR